MGKITLETIEVAKEAISSNLLEATKMEALLTTQLAVPLEIRYVDLTDIEIEIKLREMAVVITDYLKALENLQ